MAIGSKSSRTNLVAGCASCVGELADQGNGGLENGLAQENRSSSESYECPKCEKHFGHAQLLQLHLRVHESSLQLSPQHQEETNGAGARAEDAPTPPDARPRHQDDDAPRTYDWVQFPSCQMPVRKAVGLTKVRLEDCLRCDACSCIYLEQGDYDKHMKNFHRQDSPKKHKLKKGCRSCCRHCNCRGDHQHQSTQKERGNNNLFHYNIKDRWTKMVSRRLNPDELKQEMKPDPDDSCDVSPPPVDYSHLLSQVEVKIKVEPPEEQDFAVK